MAVTAPSVLDGNLLTVADSDFEAGSPTWAASVNAGTVAVAATTAFSGTASLGWKATAAGNSTVATGFYPVKAGLTYTASAYITTGSAAFAFTGVSWYNASHTLISSTPGPPNGSRATARWQPVFFAATAPPLAAFATLTATVTANAAAEQEWLDLAYFAPTIVQVLADFFNPTFGTSAAGGNDFADITPFVRIDQNIQINRGRQDGVSEMQAGTATFQLQNNAGWFTSLSGTSPFAANGGSVALGTRVQINVADQAGGWHTRFDGAISEIDYTFAPGGGVSVAAVTVSDVFSFLNRQDPLQCWTKQTILSDTPQWHWSLNDSGHGNIAAETGGNNGPNLRAINTTTNASTFAWGASTGGIETLADASAPGQPAGGEFWSTGSVQPNTLPRGLDAGVVGPFSSPMAGIYLTPVQTNLAAQNTALSQSGTTLAAKLPTVINVNTGSFSVECFFTMDPLVKTHTGAGQNYGPFVPLSLGNSRTGRNVALEIATTGTASTLAYACQFFAQPPAFSAVNTSAVTAPIAGATGAGFTADATQLPHHMVCTFSAGVATLWVDGNVQTTVTGPAGQAYDMITVGGMFGGWGVHVGGLSLVSVYNYALSQNQIAWHCMNGQTGMWEMTTDDCISALGNFASVPGYWSNINANHAGLTLTEYQDITGSNAITSMQLYEQAEQGLLYADSSGTLNFHTRDWRMGYGAPDLSLPADVYGADLGYELIDQFLINEANVGTQVYSSGVSAINAASQGQVGAYANGTAQSPTQLPLITWSRNYGTEGLAPWLYWADPALNDIASWEVNTRSTPRLTCGTLSLDLLTLDSIAGVTISQIYALEIDRMVALAGVPVQFPTATGALELFIEGMTETISLTQRAMTLYTSPAMLQRAWRPGDVTYGQLGITSRVGVSQPDLSQVPSIGKAVAHDAGPPFWPPAISSTMNNPAGNGHGFLGALDLRGITQSFQMALQPPMLVVTQQTHTQAVGTGSVSANPVIWDTVLYDTVSGMGAVVGFPSWYCVLVPGYYEICATLPWGSQTTGSAGCRGAWVMVAQQAAQQVAAGTGSPMTGAYVFPIGSQTGPNNLGVSPRNAVYTRQYLGVGDMVQIGAYQNQGVSLFPPNANPGAMMSLRWLGYATTDDQDFVLGLPATGTGAGRRVQRTKFIKTYNATATYSYYGIGETLGTQLHITNGAMFQGQANAVPATASQFSFAVMPFSTMVTDLSGATGISATVKMTNASAWWPTGTKLMLGFTSATAGGSTFVPAATTQFDLVEQSFAVGQTVTFSIHTGIVTNFQSHGATALAFGNNVTTSLDYYGSWAGGAGANVQMIVTYFK